EASSTGMLQPPVSIRLVWSSQPVVSTSQSYNVSLKILFLHGWTSVPGGVKPIYLAQHGHEVLNPALPDEDFEEAGRIAQAEYDRHHPDVVVGSSDEEPGTFGPRRVSKKELHDAFAQGWAIESIEPSRFEA